jgi:5-methylcytosine-specific restriction endonuclease McrA
MGTVVNHIERAVAGLLAGREKEAREELQAIDFRELNEMRTATRGPIWDPGGLATGYKSSFPSTRREPTKRADARATFLQDSYTCRYCSRPTVALEVLKLLSKAFPQDLPYHRNWRPVEEHIVYWTCSTSLEHIVPFPAGGKSNLKNLVTACYLCNDAKNCLPLDLLGWTVRAQAHSDWLGLTEHVSKLRTVVKHLGCSSLALPIM